MFMQRTVESQNASKWDIRFLELAKFIGSWSKDPSTKAGAVVVRPDKTICSVGYNGFPMSMCDLPNRYDDRDDKYSRIIHAEMNAVLNSKESVSGYTLYVWPLICCDRCAVHMIQAGISRVVSPTPSQDVVERWGESMDRTHSYFEECGVGICEINGLV